MANKMIDEGSLPSFQKYMDENMPAVATSTTSLSTSTIVLTPSITIRTASSSIRVAIADNETTRDRGLGGVDSLGDDEGMLFVFSFPDIPNFWMKDMKIPLDMIWIDENKTVVGVADNIATSTFPKTFSSGKPVLYVLEINAGVSKKLGIKAGTRLQFDLNKTDL